MINFVIKLLQSMEMHLIYARRTIQFVNTRPDQLFKMSLTLLTIKVPLIITINFNI